ncbi:MAG: modification methylase, partial [Clostridia bacterium]|nr:modification methylase [Clostridia bacterium]
MAKSDTLRNARKEKNDEFYTQLIDIEKELKYYKSEFKDKIVFCNCDDPFESNFFKYFAMNFNHLGLKKLIATCYDNSPIAF